MNYRASKTFVWMMVMLAMLMGLLAGCTEPPSPTNVTASAAPTTQRPTATPTAIPTQPPTQPTQPATQPTQPAPQPTEPPAPEDPVPEALRNNYYLGSKGYGACAEMTGNIHLLIVFVSDSISKWTEGDILETKNAFADHETKLEEAATQRGAKMDVSMSYLEATISTEFRDDGKVLTSAYTTMRKLGMGDAFYDQDSLEEQYGANAVPILFVLNRQ